jgi:D-sedoheptulose 7-phosphate isomerase
VSASQPSHDVFLPLPSRTARADVFQESVCRSLTQRRLALNAALVEMAEQPREICEAADLLYRTLRSGSKVLIAGNGGSAADAQHFAAELVGRFKRERRPYPVVALTTDTSILTAIANDYGYDQVFARQVGAHGTADDLLVLFSTSGQSENVVRAALAARDLSIRVIALTGKRPSRLSQVADLCVRVPSTETPVVQELHQTLIHVLCDLVETELTAFDGARQ